MPADMEAEVIAAREAPSAQDTPPVVSPPPAAQATDEDAAQWRNRVLCLIELS
jgi:hypothetical protein